MNEVNMGDVPLDPAMFAETQQSLQSMMGLPMQMGLLSDHEQLQHQQLQQQQQHSDVLDHAHAHQLQHNQHQLSHQLSQEPNGLDQSHDVESYPQQETTIDHNLDHDHEHEHDLTAQPPLPDTLPPTTDPSSTEPAVPTKSESPNKTPDDDDKEYALPLLRQLALELGKDRPKNGDLSKESRIAIVSAVAAGQSKNAVAEAFGISPSTVRRALERWQTRHSNASRPKPGRKPKLTHDAELLLVQAAQTQPGASLKELGAQYGVCYATAKTVLKKHRAGRYSDLPPDPPPEATAAAS